MLTSISDFFIAFSYRTGKYLLYFYCSSPKDEGMYLYKHRTGRNPLEDSFQSSIIFDLMSYDLFHNCF